MEREFIAERQKGLQAYLDVITTHHILSNCELVKKFLDPNSYSVNYTGKWGTAIQVRFSVCVHLPAVLARACTDSCGVDGRNNLQNYHAAHVIIYGNVPPALCINCAAIVNLNIGIILQRRDEGQDLHKQNLGEGS